MTPFEHCPLAEPKEDAPCTNCVRHGVACSLAGGPHVRRHDPESISSWPISRSAARGIQTRLLEGEPSSGISVTRDHTISASLPPGPYASLTAGIERCPSGELENWKLQVQLMHHYMANTKLIMTEHHDMDNLLRIFQCYLPEVAFDNEYVMHALLALSALHKARHEPEHARMLKAAAIHHLDQAVTLQQEIITPLIGYDSAAQFAFHWLMTFAGFAVANVIAPIDAMTNVFSLLRRTDTVIDTIAAIQLQEPLRSLVSQVRQGSAGLPAQRFPDHVVHSSLPDTRSWPVLAASETTSASSFSDSSILLCAAGPVGSKVVGQRMGLTRPSGDREDGQCAMAKLDCVAGVGSAFEEQVQLIYLDMKLQYRFMMIDGAGEQIYTYLPYYEVVPVVGKSNRRHPRSSSPWAAAFMQGSGKRPAFSSHKREGAHEFGAVVSAQETASESDRISVMELPSSANLRITIIAADGLYKRDVFRFPDPFAVATISGEQTRTTGVIKKTLNPYWNESFDMRVTEESILAVQIFDQKKFKKKDQGFLGVVNVRIGSVIDLDAGGDGAYRTGLLMR
nr:putative e3 ubiquitin-protein ligase hula [Quercus suber]